MGDNKARKLRGSRAEEFRKVIIVPDLTRDEREKEGKNQTGVKKEERRTNKMVYQEKRVV